jgi:Flp pilus assembly protein TadG
MLLEGPYMDSRFLKFVARLRRFSRSNRGNVAMIFAIALVPLVLGAAAGMDFARAMLVRQQMSAALDAAALAVGSSKGLNQSTAQDLAQKYFNANFTVDTTAYGVPTVSIPSGGYNGAGSVQLTATDTMPTVLMKLAGIPTLALSTTSTVVWGQTKLWVALVLDNSGSMSQGDSSGSKISALKDAITNSSYGLLNTLQNAAANPGDVKVGLVPFTNDVKPGTGLCSGCIDWTRWSAQGAAEVPASTTGPGDSCSTSYNYGCRLPGTNSSTSTIPSTGGTAGYICPWAYSSSSKVDGTNGHYFMGCFTSIATGLKATISSGSNATCNGYSAANCSCSGSGSSTTCKTNTWTHTSWVAETDHSLWKGCVTDRTQDYDIQNAQPSGSSGFEADNNDYCPGAAIYNLSYDWTTLNTKVNAMAAAGSTNQAIGVAHGWQMLTPGDPYSTPSVPANTSRVMILFSDGLNTQDRWYGNGSTEGSSYDASIDTRMHLACTAAKTDGVVIYSIFVHIGTSGSSSALQDCATDSSKYYDLTSSSQIQTAFQDIAQKITAVRVSH